MRKKIVIDGKETRYSVSDDGKIYNDKTGRELKGTYTTNEYHSIQLRIDNKSRTFMVHRLVAEAFCENPNGYTIVDHIDRDKHNDKASNLRWVTTKENNLNKERFERRNPDEYYDGDFTKCEWKPVYGFEDIYMVSENGVFVKKKTKKILAQNDRHGYKRVSLNQCYYSVNVKVWESFNNQAVPEGYEVDHIDGIRSNNHISNLRILTHSESMKNSYKNGHAGAVKIYQFDKEGNFINSYNSIREAAEAISGNEIAIKAASDRKGTSSEYYWLREEDKDNILEIINSWVPEGYKIIPSHPTYAINKKGEVYNKRNRKNSPIKYFKDGSNPYIIIRGVHYSIEKLLNETYN